MTARGISILVRQLSPMRREFLLDRIEEQHKVNLFLGKPIHSYALYYTTALLCGRQPEPLTRIRRRNGRVKIIRKGG